MRAIHRKEGILKRIGGEEYIRAWTGGTPGRLAKGKIHCSCPMCRKKSYDSPSVTMDGKKIANPKVMTFGGESYLILAENPDDNSSDLNFYDKRLTYDYLARVSSSAPMDATATTYPYIMNVKPLSKVTKGGETYYCGTIYLPYKAVVPANTEVYIATKIEKAPIHESNANQTAFETLKLVKVGVAGSVVPATHRCLSRQPIRAISTSRMPKNCLSWAN